jgi:hypothetical protein
MDRRSGSMKIMSSQRLLVQPVVTACGHVEEGPSADELHLEISGSRLGVSRHWIIRMSKYRKGELSV